MIIRRLGSTDLLISQPEHAALSARILREWHADHFPDSPRKASILHAIEEHDGGWDEIDEALVISETALCRNQKAAIVPIIGAKLRKEPITGNSGCVQGSVSAAFTSTTLSSLSRSMSLSQGSMPARAGSRGTVMRIVCLPLRMRCRFR